MEKKVQDVLKEKGNYLDPDVIDELRSDYEELLEKEEKELSNKLELLYNTGIKEERIKNLILSKYNSGVWFRFS